MKKTTQNNKNKMPMNGGNKIYWIYGGIALIFLLLNFGSTWQNEEKITKSEFLQKIESNEVKSVTFITNSGYAIVELINSDNKKRTFKYGDYKYINEQIDKIE